MYYRHYAVSRNQQAHLTPHRTWRGEPGRLNFSFGEPSPFRHASAARPWSQRLRGSRPMPASAGAASRPPDRVGSCAPPDCQQRAPVPPRRPRQGNAVSSPAQSRKLDRKPCTVSWPDNFMRLSIWSMALSESGLPNLSPEKTRSLTRTSRIRSSSATARVDNGTTCSRPAFIRPAGIVHRRRSRSTSSHRIPRASPERTAVRVRTPPRAPLAPPWSSAVQGRRRPRYRASPHDADARSSDGAAE